MSSDEVGRAVQQARRQQGYSLRELAERSGVEFSYIGKLERGEIEAPGAGKLQQLASALDIDLEDLYGLAGYLSPKSLPGLPAYLRAKYDLPAAAAEQVADYVAQLKADQREEGAS